jgi:hydrophobe/amphiphile efflux-1 (HAE1) family protein
VAARVGTGREAEGPGMISNFFIGRPIFAAVLSIVVTLAGVVAVLRLPIAQYPDVTPPTVIVTASYPGANCNTVQDTIAAPIEAQVNGVEGMMYVSSTCTNDGAYTLVVTFKLGTNPDMAQVLVQNRVQLALPVIPAVVQRQGINVKKQSPNTLMIVNLVSPDGRYPDTYLSNYATIQIRDELSRLPGVAGVGYLGQRDYSMRAWLDPNKMAARGLTAGDVVAAISEQNLQVAAGQTGQPPSPRGQQFQLTINTKGRLVDPEEFADIVVKVGQPGATGAQAPPANGQSSGGQITSGGSGTGSANSLGSLVNTPSTSVVRLRDVARVELGAQQYDQAATLDGQPSVALTVYGLPGANALDTADGVYAKMEELKQHFPEGMDYRIVYDTTPFVRQSVYEVFNTLRDAIILVAIVVLVFLQNWRAAVIPLVAVPVAIVGTFAVMAALGFSLNNLTLFGLVLAIGIVVDDAIVVVENVERWLEHGLAPHEAARKAMAEVTGPVIAVALVLTAVFVPCAFIGGVTGQFFRQFAVTIAASTLISAFNSLTLSPALAALLLRPRNAPRDVATRVMDAVLGWFFRLFNRTFAAGTAGYAWAVGKLLRVSLVVLLVYGGLLYLTYHEFTRTPTGFVPKQDKGYLLVSVQLPDSASVERTQRILAHVDDVVFGPKDPKTGERDASRGIPGVAHTVGISGQSLVLNANAPNLGSVYVMLQPFDQRSGADQSADAIAATIQERCRKEVRGAVVSVAGAPPIEGLGTTGGFKLVIEDRGNLGMGELQRVSDQVTADGSRTPGLVGVSNNSRTDTPWRYLEIDRTKCESLGVPVSQVFDALQYNFGSYYVNNFNEFGRNWQVNVQADPRFRDRVADIRQLQVRNNQGQMLPLGSVLSVRATSGPVLVQRYNMYAAAAVTGDVAAGTSTGEAVPLMEQIAGRDLPRQMAFEWTELTYLQNQAGNSALYAFALAVVFVFLVLAAQYESWKLPLAVVLVVPMCLLFAVVGVNVAGQDVSIFTQVGFIVLVGLACKNAILIVEFARQKQDEGLGRREAAVEASRLRLRPILMTSFAFILGVVPLLYARGAGAEMRHSLGTAVFSGMLGVTLFGVFLTPVFYSVIQWFGQRRTAPAHPPPPDRPGGPTGETAGAGTYSALSR